MSSSSPVSAEAQVQHVLVPLDGSELALSAMSTARALAERFGAELHTISVVEPGEDVDRLEGLASAALGVAAADDHVLVVSGVNVTDEILRRSQELGGCVVCLSTHGRGRLRGAVVGSVAREYVQRSTYPVVAVGPAAGMPAWAQPPSRPRPLSVARVLACVDGSGASEEVLPVASAWARALGMSLTILTVVEAAPPPLRPERHTSPYGDGGSAEAYVDALADRWRKVVPDVGGEVVRDPLGPASGIRSYLAQQPAGLVALTSHARSGVQRVLVGATAASVVHDSPSPCLVVPVRR